MEKTSTKNIRERLVSFISLMMFAPIFTFAQQTYTFTNCGATGRYGPTQAQVNAAYGIGNSLNGQVNVTSTGIQTWTVPSSGDYSITAYGASGGASVGYTHFGRGAMMSGRFTLNGGDVLKILVGQAGQNGTGSNAAGSGGGGTFVADNANTPLIVAGGGGGGGNGATVNYAMIDGRITSYGPNYATTGRNAAGGGGGSYNVTSTNTPNGGQSFIAGGVGGDLASAGGGIGGFGGGGGSAGGNSYTGGAGGYSGGDETTSLGAFYQAQEGGGGSFNAGINQTNVGGVNIGHGKVIIEQLTVPVPCAGVNTPTIGSANATVCAGQSVTISGAGATPSLNVDYQWLESTIPSGGFVPASSTSTVFGALQIPSVSTGTLYYMLAATCNNIPITANSNVIAVVGNPSPATPVAAVSPTAVCAGGNYSFTSSSSTGGVNYVWTGPNSFNSSLQNPNLNNATPASSGVYSVMAQAFGCNSPGYGTVTISTLPIPTVAIATGGSSFACLGSPKTLTLTATAGTSYTWSTGAQNVSTINVSPTIPTTYTAIAANALGCTGTASVALSIINATINAIGASACNSSTGGTGVFTVNTFTPSSVYWYSSPTNTVPISVVPSNSITGSSTLAVNNATTNTTLYAAALSGGGGGNDSLSTPLDGGTTNIANMFDISATNAPLIVTGFDVLAGAGTNVFEIWWNPVSVAISGTGSVGWTLLTTYTFVGLGTTSFYHTIPLTPGNELPVAANQTVGLYFVPVSGNIYYSTAATLGTIRAQNTDMTLYGGRRGANFNGATLACGWNGRVHYKKPGGCTSPMLPVTLTIAPQPTVTATGTTICQGEVATITVGGATSYSVNGVANSSFTFTPANTTNYAVTGIGTLNNCVSNSAVVTVSVKAKPIVAITSAVTICSGNTATLIAGGAATYTVDNSMPLTGNSFTVSPSSTTVYSVTGTGANGCLSANTAVSTVSVNTTPTISANSGLICKGDVYNMTVTGADTYSVNGTTNSTFTFSPANTTSYVVTGKSDNCFSNTVIATVSVSPLPTVSISGNSIICVGETAVLTADGADTYTWNSTNAATSISVQPSSHTSYSVQGVTLDGCEGFASVTVYVHACTGVDELNENSEITVYPNPNSGEFVVELNDGSAKSVELYDLTGRVVLSNTASDSKVNVNINHLSNGVYYLKVTSDSTTKMVKVVKQ